MFCPECGKKSDGSTRYCPSCGADLKMGGAPPVQPQQSYGPQPVYQSTPNQTPPPPSYQSAPPPKAAPQQNLYSVKSIVFGALSIVLGASSGLLGIIFAIIGLATAKNHAQAGVKLTGVGKGLSIGGLILSILMSFFWVIYIVMVAAAASSGMDFYYSFLMF